MTLEIVRADRVRRRRITVPAGTLVRDALRRIGQPPEGSAVLVDAMPVPLDTPIEGPMRLTVVPTFSGG